MNKPPTTSQPSLATLGAALILTAALSPAMAQPRKIVWSDEFDGPAGAAPDPAKWVYDLGANGWGNQELETYTDTRANSHLDGEGHLVIEALESAPHQYTSARLKTQGKFSVTYGRIEARLRIPYGQGIWPAFWMLGEHAKGKGWPDCGEIDIMENIGKEPDTVHGTVHGPGYFSSNGIGKSLTIESGRFADDYHVYAVEWSPGRVEFLVDDKSYFVVTPTSLPKGKKWVFDHPFFIIVNVAVGGSWPGNPDETSVYPQKMLVDYVRVYERAHQTTRE